MKPFDLAPNRLDGRRLKANVTNGDVYELCDYLLQKFRNDLREKLQNDQFDIRYLRAITFLVPYLSEHLDTKNMTALEIGSGHGAKSLALSHIFSEYVGLEIVPTLAKYAEAARQGFGCSNLFFHVESAENIETFLAGQPRKFDVIILYAVLEHLTIEEKLTTLRICWDHLADDGHLFIGEAPNRMLPLDLHSTKLLYFQQMPLDLWKYCFDQSLNRDWARVMKIGLERGDFDHTAYRRGIHLGHQEFELGLLPLEDLRRHIVADNYSSTMLNQYVYLNLEYLKLLEFYQFQEFEGRTDVAYQQFPSLFSRYFIEGIFRKSPVANPLEDITIVRPQKSHDHPTTRMLEPAYELPPGAELVIDSPDPGGKFDVVIEVANPYRGGVLSAQSHTGSIVGTFDVRSLMNSISSRRGRIVFEVGELDDSDFPLLLKCEGEQSVMVNHVFFRPTHQSTHQTNL